MNCRVTALAQDNRSATGRVAISLPLSSTVRYIFEPFIRLNSIRLQPYLNVKLFADTEEGIGWVIESLPPHIKAQGR